MNIQHKIILNEAKDYFFIAFGLFLYTIAFTVFLMPYQIVAGGVTGLSAIIYYATGFHLENTYIIINGILLLVALKILGVRFLIKTIFAIFTLYFMLKFAQDIIPKQENGLPFKLMGEGQDFMSMIIGCVITGIALATVFMNNGSTGGTDIIAASVNKFHPNVSLGNVLIAADFCIIGSCMFYPQFGTLLERAHKVMFGFCVMAMENYTLDYVMNARRQSVQFFQDQSSDLHVDRRVRPGILFAVQNGERLLVDLREYGLREEARPAVFQHGLLPPGKQIFPVLK